MRSEKTMGIWINKSLKLQNNFMLQRKANKFRNAKENTNQHLFEKELTH